MVVIEAGCSKLAEGGYRKWLHGQVVKCLHWIIRQKRGFEAESIRFDRRVERAFDLKKCMFFMGFPYSNR